MRPLTPGTLRARLHHAGSVNGTASSPRGSTLGRLAAGAPVVLSAEFIASHVVAEDRPVDLSLAEFWLLTDDTLTPVVP